MKNKEWINKLNDSEISRILRKDLPVKKIPASLDNKVISAIRNKEEQDKRKIIYFQRAVVKYAFAFSSIVIIILSMMTGLKFFSSRSSYCTVYDISGSAYKLADKDKIQLINNEKIKENTTLFTEAGSSFSLKIGSESFVNIKENSKIKITKLFKSNKTEKSNIYLSVGYAYFAPKLYSGKSRFEVETDILKLSVHGTKFSINASADKSTKVEVYNGSVYLQQKYGIDREFIKKINKNFEAGLESALKTTSVLNAGESINVSIDDIKGKEKEISDITNSIKAELNANIKNQQKINEILKNREHDIEDIKNIISSFIAKKVLLNQTNKNDGIEKKATYKTEKLSGNPGILLTEKNTAITSDNKNIYISSDSNNSVYCIDSSSGKLVWKFSDEKLKDITSPAKPFLNSIIIAAPENIIELDKNGSIKNIFKTDNGARYWAAPVYAENKLFIPTSKNIYFFDGSSIKPLENFPDSLGQLYITFGYNKIYFIDSNENKVKIFDLSLNKIIWESVKLANRIFSPPVAGNGSEIFVADFNSKIYKFNYNINNSPQTLELESGAVSNLIYKVNNIYLVANNGWFYKINAVDFKRCEKIMKVDNKPNYNNYLTKKLFQDNNDLYFCTDAGRVFYYDMAGGNSDFITIKENKDNNPLVGTPVKINEAIYFIDTKFNVYRIKKFYE